MGNSVCVHVLLLDMFLQLIPKWSLKKKWFTQILYILIVVFKLEKNLNNFMRAQHENSLLKWPFLSAGCTSPNQFPQARNNSVKQPHRPPSDLWKGLFNWLKFSSAAAKLGEGGRCRKEWLSQKQAVISSGTSAGMNWLNRIKEGWSGSDCSLDRVT